MGSAFSSNQKCVFCEIIQGIDDSSNEENKKVLAHNEMLAIFADIRPASQHHYLVVPKHHKLNAKTLNGEDDKKLVLEMYEYGKQFLGTVINSENFDEALFGFHFPPFISVDHLHLHCIYPSTTMSFIQSIVFHKNSWYFVSPEAVIDRLS